MLTWYQWAPCSVKGTGTSLCEHRRQGKRGYHCRNLSSSLSVNLKQSRTQFCKELQIPDVISGSKLSQRINWITPVFRNKDVTVVFINHGQGVQKRMQAAAQIYFKCKVSAAVDKKKKSSPRANITTYFVFTIFFNKTISIANQPSSLQ